MKSAVRAGVTVAAASFLSGILLSGTWTVAACTPSP
jgi:hypothetical protein